jgi:hypothetical protein
VSDSLSVYQSNAHLIRSTWKRLEKRLTGYPGGIGRMGKDFMKREGGDGQQYFSSPQSTPLLHLPIWMARDISSNTLLKVLEATALLYFYVRIQDDVLDEPLTRGRPEWLLLGNCLIWDATSVFFTISSRPTYHRACGRALGEFSRATAAERVQLLEPRRRYSLKSFQNHAAKAAIAEIPLLSVLAIRDRWAMRPHVEKVVRLLGQAYGLINDIYGFRSDLAASHETFLISELRASQSKSQRKSGPRLMHTLMRTEIIERNIELAIRLHTRANAAAMALGMSAFPEYTDQRTEWLRLWSRQITLARLAYAVRSTQKQT